MLPTHKRVKWLFSPDLLCEKSKKMLKPFLVFLALDYCADHVFSSSLKSSRSRWKRVVNGLVPIVDKGRTFEYEVVRYFAWIGVATSCTSHKTVPQDVPKWWVYSMRPCLPDIDDQRCGGALIHPRIVQTAGHCVGSHILQIDDPAQVWAPGRVWSVWEDMLIIYVGFTDLEDFQYPSYSRFFLLHPRYARLRNTSFDWVSHDYGWIILNSEAYKLDHWPNYVAPALTSKALKEGTTDLLRNQDICLFAGYGAWQNIDNQVEFINTTSSRFLRYGWQMTTTYYQCWYYLDIVTRHKKSRKWRYTNFATWFCHVPFGAYLNVHPSVGDSGSPVHCNGKMLALISGGKWQFTDSKGMTRNHITRTMGLAYSIFENSANFRQYFVATLKYYARVRQVGINFTYDKYPARRPQVRAINEHSVVLEHHSKSGGMCCTIHIFYAISMIQILLNITTFFL